MSTPVRSDAELARALGVGPAVVCRLKKRGMPVDTVEAARAWRNANLNPAMRVDMNPVRQAAMGARRLHGLPLANEMASVDDYSSSRARRERAEATMAEIELARISGTVLDRESALRAVFTKFRELRDSSMVLGRKLSPQLAAMSDEREIRIAVDRALGEVFETFAKRSLQSLADNLTGKPTAMPSDVLQAPSAPAPAELAQQARP